MQRVGIIVGSGMSGNFTLSFGGNTTGYIAYNASAATVQSALEGLASIGSGNVSVTKVSDTPLNQQWRITFQGSLAAANQNQVTIDTSGIFAMGGKTDVQATDQNGQPATTDEVQTVTLSNATGGTFRLAFLGQTTAAIAYNASAATVESALEALQAVDQVTVTGNAGGPWTITFAGTHADTNVQQIQGDAAAAESGSVARTLSFTYDAANQLTAASDADSAYAYTYDNLGRLLTTSNSGTPNFPTVVLTNAYNSAGDRSSLSATVAGTADFKNDFTYDDLHRVTRVEQNSNGGNTVASKRASFEYNGLGLLTKLARENKPSGSWAEIATSHYTYDDDNRLTSLDHKRGGSNLFTGFAWTYDAMNRVTQETSVDGTTTYTYDKNNRLTGADFSYQTDETFSYDDNGNRTMSGYSIGADNQVLSDGTYNYDYDDEGNLTKRTKISDSSYTEYTWDYHNRLTQILEKNSSGTILKQYDFTYDLFGRRIAVSADEDGAGSGAAVVSRSIYDGDHVAFGLDGSNAIKHRYLYAPNIDTLLADEDSLNAILTPLGNNVGSVTHLINTTGSVQNHITYGAFGNVTSQTNSSVTFLQGYAGMQSAVYGGLNYALHNNYYPATGSFVTPTIWNSNVGNYNFYSYALASATNFVQPGGMMPMPSQPSPTSSQGTLTAAQYAQMMQQAFPRHIPSPGFTYSPPSQGTYRAGMANRVMVDLNLPGAPAFAQAHYAQAAFTAQLGMIPAAMIPGLGFILNFTEAYSGKDAVTGVDLVWYEQWLAWTGIALSGVGPAGVLDDVAEAMLKGFVRGARYADDAATIARHGGKVADDAVDQLAKHAGEAANSLKRPGSLPLNLPVIQPACFVAGTPVAVPAQTAEHADLCTLGVTDGNASWDTDSLLLAAATGSLTVTGYAINRCRRRRRLLRLRDLFFATLANGNSKGQERSAAHQEIDTA